MTTSDKNRLQTILDTACSLFESQGYERVTVNDICRSCQITKPTFYKYVTSKDSILYHYYRSVESNAARKTRTYMEEDEYLKAIHASLLEHNLVSIRAGTEVLKQYLIATLKHSAPSYHYMEQTRESMIEAISTMQARGAVSDKYSAKELYFVLILAIQGAGISWTQSEEDFDLTKVCNVVIAEILKGQDELISLP